MSVDHLSDPAPALDIEADGRRRRGQDNRARIVKAMLDLTREGEITPVAERVAARADVGLRTVFRHFKDMDSLYSEMSEVIEVELAGVIYEPLKATFTKDRLIELIQRRALVFERISPFKYASEIHRHRSPFLEKGHARMVTGMRAALKSAFGVRLSENPVRFEAMDLILSYESWSRLRRDQGLTPEQACEVLICATEGLLA